MRLLFFVAAIFCVSYSCAHHPDVRPGPQGVHTISLEASDKQAGTRNAIRQANSYCKKTSESTAQILGENTDYSGGDLSEERYKQARGVGRALGAFGGILGAGGGVVQSAIGSAYNVGMKFKCQ